MHRFAITSRRLLARDSKRRLWLRQASLLTSHSPILSNEKSLFPLETALRIPFFALKKQQIRESWHLFTANAQLFQLAASSSPFNLSSSSRKKPTVSPREKRPKFSSHTKASSVLFSDLSRQEKRKLASSESHSKTPKLSTPPISSLLPSCSSSSSTKSHIVWREHVSVFSAVKHGAAHVA